MLTRYAHSDEAKVCWNWYWSSWLAPFFMWCSYITYHVFKQKEQNLSALMALEFWNGTIILYTDSTLDIRLPAKLKTLYSLDHSTLDKIVFDSSVVQKASATPTKNRSYTFSTGPFSCLGKGKREKEKRKENGDCCCTLSTTKHEASWRAA
jgi:hypothetical protein